MKISFGKVWMIRKRPFCRPKKLSWEGSKQTETKQKEEKVLLYIILLYIKTYRQSK